MIGVGPLTDPLAVRAPRVKQPPDIVWRAPSGAAPYPNGWVQPVEAHQPNGLRPSAPKQCLRQLGDARPILRRDGALQLLPQLGQARDSRFSGRRVHGFAWAFLTLVVAVFARSFSGAVGHRFESCGARNWLSDAEITVSFVRGLSTRTCNARSLGARARQSRRRERREVVAAAERAARRSKPHVVASWRSIRAAIGAVHGEPADAVAETDELYDG